MLIFDIETTVIPDKEFSDLGFLGVQHVEGIGWGDKGEAYSTDIPAALRELEHKHLIGHNVFRFDLPVLDRLHGWVTDQRVDDTLIMSQLLCPERESHSLDSWGRDFNLIKPDLSDLRERCLQDIRITRKLFLHLEHLKEKKGIPDAVFRMEYKVAQIIAKQHLHGVAFDAQKARELVEYIDKRMLEIHTEITILEPAVPIPESQLKAPPVKQFKKDGTPSQHLLNYLEAHGKTTSDVVLPLKGPITGTKPLDVSKPDEVKKFLLEKGWKPTIWNYSGFGRERKRTSPKFYDKNKELCPNLAAMELPVVKDIAEYLSLRNRRSVLLGKKGDTGWLCNTRVLREGRITSDADTVGATTGRFTHRIVANVPRVTSVLGKEMRSLFYAPDGRVLVGWDASSLEARMEAHYTYQFDRGKYAEELLEGDIHTKNQHAVGLPTRDKSKTFKYAITYGAQENKLASEFGWSVPDAKQRLEAYWESNPALRKVKAILEEQARRLGYIVALDGRHIPVDSPHKALNCAFQSAGAIVMKYAMCIAERNITRLGLDAFGIIRYHDEEQWESAEEDADAVGIEGVRSVELAGKYLRLRVPLAAEYKVGKSWCLTH